MIVIELTEDKFGKAMKSLACAEDKIQEIKEMLRQESMDHRSHNMYPQYRYEDEDFRMRGGHTDNYNRYM